MILCSCGKIQAHQLLKEGGNKVVCDKCKREIIVSVQYKPREGDF